MQSSSFVLFLLILYFTGCLQLTPTELNPAISTIPASSYYHSEEEQLLHHLIRSEPKPNRIWLLTGPQLSGKSTLMKHVSANYSNLYLDIRQEFSPIINANSLISLMYRSSKQYHEKPPNQLAQFCYEWIMAQFVEEPSVVAIDDAHELKRLIREPGGKDVFETFMNWLIALVKTEHVTVLMATSDGFFHSYLATECREFNSIG